MLPFLYGVLMLASLTPTNRAKQMPVTCSDDAMRFFNYYLALPWWPSAYRKPRPAALDP
jgi:hypothetical protein